jgi:hypothetical protein
LIVWFWLLVCTFESEDVMVTYEIEEQKERELMDRLCKEWNAKYYSASTKRYSYKDSLTIEEQTRINTKRDDDDDDTSYGFLSW